MNCTFRRMRARYRLWRMERARKKRIQFLIHECKVLCLELEEAQAMGNAIFSEPSSGPVTPEWKRMVDRLAQEAEEGRRLTASLTYRLERNERDQRELVIFR